MADDDDIQLDPPTDDDKARAGALLGVLAENIAAARKLNLLIVMTLSSGPEARLGYGTTMLSMRLVEAYLKDSTKEGRGAIEQMVGRDVLGGIKRLKGAPPLPRVSVAGGRVTGQIGSHLAVEGSKEVGHTPTHSELEHLHSYAKEHGIEFDTIATPWVTDGVLLVNLGWHGTFRLLRIPLPKSLGDPAQSAHESTE